MNIAFTGCRWINGNALVAFAIRESGFLPADGAVLIHGDGRGADQCADRWAKMRDIPVRTFQADWDGLGKAAGPARNRAMVAAADKLIAVWDGESRGTGGTIAEAIKKGIPVYVHMVRK